MRSRIFGMTLCCMAAGLLCACGDDQDPDTANALEAQIQAAPYTSWESPGPFGRKTESNTLHADEVRVWMNPTMATQHVDLDDCQPYVMRLMEEGEEPPPRGAPYKIWAGKVNEADMEEPRNWANQSIIVKEAYSGSDLAQFAFMARRTDGWFFAEYDGDGNLLFSGKPDLCTDCHAGALNDYTFTANLTFLCPPIQ